MVPFSPLLLGRVRRIHSSLCLDGDPVLTSEAPRLLEAHPGAIDRIDGEALLGEPDRIAPLPFPQGKHAATGPDDSRLAFEPSVWLRTVCEAFAGVPLVPEWDAGSFPARVAHGAIQPHLRKMAAPSFD